MEEESPAPSCGPGTMNVLKSVTPVDTVDTVEPDERGRVAAGKPLSRGDLGLDGEMEIRNQFGTLKFCAGEDVLTWMRACCQGRDG